MREIEVKILEIDVAVVRQKILAFGGKKVFSGWMSAILWDYPNKDLRKNKLVLRTRQKGREVELTVKQKITNGRVKEREELEVNVSDWGQINKMLKMLGYEPRYRERKHRESYALANVHFEIDHLPGIPPWLEIEATNEADLRYWGKKLGYKIKDLKPLSVRQVLKFYGKSTSDNEKISRGQ